MSQLEDGGSAFPQAQRIFEHAAQSWITYSAGGMSLHDYYVAAALQGMLANPGYKLFAEDEQSIGDITSHAHRIARITIQSKHEQ
jgi:hypothetical protein